MTAVVAGRVRDLVCVVEIAFEASDPAGEEEVQSERIGGSGAEGEGIAYARRWGVGFWGEREFQLDPKVVEFVVRAVL